MDFAVPQLVWLALAAPAAVGASLALWRRREAAEAAWAARGLARRLLSGQRLRRPAVGALLLGLAIAGAGLALARPRWGTSEQTVERRGVDVAFVIDSSLSMAARDALPSRLWVAKALVRRLAARLPGHRVAVVQAEGVGLVLTPLTVDAALVDLVLDAVEPGSLPIPGTELAPALETARGLFEEGGTGHRVIVLLSDGEDHGGGLAAAAAKLAEEGVVVHAVGVGTPEGGPIPLPAADGRTGEAAGETAVKRDEDGRVVVTRLGEGPLEALARATGGLYLRSTSAATDPTEIAAAIDRLETRTLDTETLTTLEERFQWPLALAAAALAIWLGLGAYRAAPARARTEGPR